MKDSMYSNRHAHRKGFTIVELLIVIVVIGILAAITIVAFNGIKDRANTNRVMSDLRQAEKLMRLYRVDSGELPGLGDWYSGVTMPPSSRWDTEVLQLLRDGGYLAGVGPIRDPWGQYYWYDDNDCNVGSGNSVLRSVGPDGAVSTTDDIVLTIRTQC